ncbi:MAG: DUF2975 domain-containing protein [Lachnospiraceae bacterium]|nr:DUF2975 domain-containing protein [Lachnospiraceae bacterium]
MKELSKIAKGLDIFLRIVFWLLLVMCAAAVVVAAVMLIGGEQLWQQNDFSAMVLSFNGIAYNGTDISSVNLTQTFPMMAALFVVAGPIVLYGIHIVRKMLQPMKEGRPFDTAVSKNFKKLGWFSLIYGIAEIIIKAISQHFVISALSEAALSSGAILSVEHMYDGSFILIAVLLFLFSYIFRYGEELQTQADETL